MALSQSGRSIPGMLEIPKPTGHAKTPFSCSRSGPSMVCSSRCCGHQRRRKSLCVRASVTENTEEVPLVDLQVMLEDAVRQEDYQAAAKHRDELTRRQSDSRAMVEEANRRFYDAFQRNDFTAMNDIWGQGDHVQCIHPAAACIAGRPNVMESWRVILRGAPMTISLEDVRVYAGDTVSFVTCIEVMDAGDSRGRTAATNVFEKQGGRWVMVHHHGSPAPIFV